ncbi:hypothetical protein ACN4GH_01845 [Burkholderia pseudomallei]
MDISKFTQEPVSDFQHRVAQFVSQVSFQPGPAVTAAVKPDGITDLIEQARLQLEALNSEVDVLCFALEPVRQVLPKPIGNPATSDPDEPQAVIGLRGLIERIRVATVALRELSSELRI